MSSIFHNKSFLNKPVASVGLPRRDVVDKNFIFHTQNTFIIRHYVDGEVTLYCCNKIRKASLDLYQPIKNFMNTSVILLYANYKLMKHISYS